MNQLSSNPVFARELRGVLPGSYLNERSFANAIDAYNQNIQQYPNTHLERDALYGKFLYSLYNQGDREQATQLYNTLHTSYPNSSETMLAEVQLRSSAMRSPGSGNSMLAKTTTQNPNPLPTEFALGQNYPNPFNPTSTINYDLPIDAHITLKVYDVLGKEVATLVDGFVEAGYHRETLDASQLSSGVYFYRIQAGGFVSTRKLLLLR